MKRIFVLLVVALLGASVLVPQSKADVAKAEVDTAWVMVGMPRMLHLEITVAPGSQVQWPASLRQDGFLAYDYEDRAIPSPIRKTYSSLPSTAQVWSSLPSSLL